MSNLGGYQVFTTLAKKVGGPGNLIALIAGGGAIVGGIAVKCGEFAVKKESKQLLIVRKTILQLTLTPFIQLSEKLKVMKAFGLRLEIASGS